MTSILGAYWADASPAFWLLAAALTGLAVVGVWLTAVDIRMHRLPNRIVLPSYPVAVLLLGAAAAVAGDWSRLGGMAGGAGLLWLGYFLVHRAYPAGLGFGDVKLAGLLGLYLGFVGWHTAWWGTLAGFLLAGLWGLLLILARKGNGATAFPFGPFMILGAVLALAGPG